MRQSPREGDDARRAGRDVVGWGLIALGVAVFLLFSIGWATRGAGAGPLPPLLAAAFLPLYWIAAFLAFRASRNPALEAQGQRGWLLLAVANGALALNNLLFFAGVQVLHSAVFVGLASLTIQSAWYALMFIALGSLVGGMDSKLERATFWLDAATVFASGLLILVFAFEHTPGESSGRSLAAALGTVAFPALTGAVIFAAIIVWLRPAVGVSRGAIALVAIAAALTLTADLTYFRVALDEGHTGGTWYELVYMLAAVVSVVAAQVQRVRTPSPAPQYDIISSRSSVLPYLAVCTALLILVLDVGTEWQTSLGLLVLSGVLLTILVMSRQLIARRYILDLAERERAHGERFRSLVEHGSDLIMVTDRAGTIRSLMGNRAGVLGRAVARLDGQPLSALAHPDDAALLTAAIAGGTTAPGRPLRWRSRDTGEGMRELETVVHDLSDEPAVGGIVLNTRDVSEQKALELELQQSQKLEALGLLAGGVAHDVNNVLAVVRASADLMAAAPDEETRREDLEEIVRAVDRGAALTRQLLAFARRDAMQVRHFDLRDVVTSMHPMLDRLLTRDVELVAVTAPSPVPVACDRGQIEQVLLNLVVNARDAMPEGGEIRIDVGTATRARGAEEEPIRQYACIAVRDSGTGITDAVRARLFEPFFTTKPRGKGTGLGLSTVFSIVDRAGGFVEVGSTPGSGTTFEVFLPIADPTVGSDVVESPTSVTAADGRERILVVDDEPAIRDAIARFLRGKGYDVTTAGDGAAAYDAVAQGTRPFDLLLTDLMMPGISGRTLIERVLAFQPAIRVICMTGYAEPGLDDDALDVPLIEKPFDLEALARLLRETLDVPAE